MLTPGQKGLLAAAALIFTLIWFAQLGGRALYDPDEGRYAEIPREMLSGGDWVIPHLDGLAYLEKPPLQYWMTALAYEAFGQSEGSARLFTGVCGYLSLVLVFFTGSRLWGFAAGLRAAMLTAASTLFVLLGHQLTLDMALNFFLLACLACFVEAQLRRDSPRAQRAWMLGCWCAAALAVLTKGLIGVLIPATTLAVYTIWQRDSRALRLNAGWGSALFAAIALPWFILAAHANAEFLKFFFVREHFQRFLTPIEHRSEPWWFFIAVLAGGILPWL
ncbi:MAG: glycosyltransferase family 39 protein, partial [Steroidobacteraceae bacterium]